MHICFLTQKKGGDEEVGFWSFFLHLPTPNHYDQNRKYRFGIHFFSENNNIFFLENNIILSQPWAMYFYSEQQEFPQIILEVAKGK